MASSRKKYSRLVVLVSASLLVPLASCAPNGASSQAGLSSSSTTSEKSSVTALYTLSFYSDGGTQVADLHYHEGDIVKAPSDPTKKGYNFQGWYSDYAHTALFDFSKPMPGDNLVLYAFWKAVASATPEQIQAYMDNLASTSEKDHLYVHYLRYDNTAESYNDWDIWCWPYKPKAGEGYKFDWVGRTPSSDLSSATGSATLSEFDGVNTGAYVDIDLTKSYDGGWDNINKTIGGTEVSFAGDTQVGIQIVQSSTRTGSSSFWTNDGSNLYVTLSDYALANSSASGGSSYHVFLMQGDVQNPQKQPITVVEDPFASDDGANVTYGQSKYNDVDWGTEAALTSTSPQFLRGDGASSYLQNGAGVGYQIMVASFADSDGDGFGDIYGIDQKLDYLKNLGVNVLWLTPIQVSDSYHGYDIADYTLVDPKFGSSKSPAGLKAGGVTKATALLDYEQLVADAHSHGMAIVMDLVLNHTSTTNPWFINAAKLNETYRGYYQWGNHETDAHITAKNYWYPYGDTVYSYYAKFGSAMPELNYAYKSTREAVASLAKTWCSRGVDGFRMDAVKHIFLNDEITASAGDTIISDTGSGIDYSSNLTKNLHFWRQLASDVKKDYPNCFFVGENFDGHAYHGAPYYEGFDSMFDFYTYFNMTSAASHGLNSASPVTALAFSGASDAGGPFSASGDSSASNASTSIKYGGCWNLRGVLSANNQYRTGGTAVGMSDASGYAAIDGCFTSNHDIARVVNRIAGGAAGNFDSNGISAQANISDASTYADSLEPATICTMISELMLPGCTWIYYGDELGLTGNFPSGKSSTSDYADLYYRQPMKWTQGGAVGDGSFQTGYAITGSGITQGLDAFNSSAVVASAESQVATEGSVYKTIASFASAKSTLPTLIRGTYKPIAWSSDVLQFERVLTGHDTYKVVVNFGGNSVSAGLTGTVVASYHGASLTALPARSALLIKE
jgi:uncharacterized repeat protein (TIGR02543 family)